MSVLLDTYALLWDLSGDPKLSKRAGLVFYHEEDPAFSVVSLWEIGIKLGLQRQDFALEENWWRN